MFFKEFDVALLRRDNRRIRTFKLNGLGGAGPAENDSDLPAPANSREQFSGACR
jgi:hypothetical protein